MERLGTWQFAVFWGMTMVVLVIPGGALIEWQSKGTVDFSFLIPYSFTVAVGSAIAATIGRRKRLLKRGRR
jgi:hypothetical protein